MKSTHILINKNVTFVILKQKLYFPLAPMKQIKINCRHIWEGMESSFDLFGKGFQHPHNSDTVRYSWHRVGIFFSNGFDKYQSIDVGKDKLPRKLESR